MTVFCTEAAHELVRGRLGKEDCCGLNCTSLEKGLGVLCPRILRFTDNQAKLRPLGWVQFSMAAVLIRRGRPCPETGTQREDDQDGPRRGAWSRIFTAQEPGTRLTSSSLMPAFRTTGKKWLTQAKKKKKKERGGRCALSTNVQRQESGGCDPVVRSGLRRRLCWRQDLVVGTQGRTNCLSWIWAVRDTSYKPQVQSYCRFHHTWKGYPLL